MDRIRLRLNLEIHDLLDRLGRTSLYLQDDKPSLQKAKEFSDLSFLDDSKYKERLDSLANLYEEVLLQDSHIGDCTCVAASCYKCFAESRIGVDTLALSDGTRLGKHEGSLVYSTFSRLQAEHTIPTCAAAIEHIEAHPVVAQDTWQKSHLERWKQERINALNWLKRYRTERLNLNAPI